MNGMLLIWFDWVLVPHNILDYFIFLCQIINFELLLGNSKKYILLNLLRIWWILITIMLSAWWSSISWISGIQCVTSKERRIILWKEWKKKDGKITKIWWNEISILEFNMKITLFTRRGRNAGPNANRLRCSLSISLCFLYSSGGHLLSPRMLLPPDSML